MIRKALLSAAIFTLALTSLVAVLYVTNPPPAVPAISLAAARSGRPFVVKIHAQWCPVCMVTKSIWSQIESAYATRANLVVFDSEAVEAQPDLGDRGVESFAEFSS